MFDISGCIERIGFGDRQVKSLDRRGLFCALIASERTGGVRAGRGCYAESEKAVLYMAAFFRTYRGKKLRSWGATTSKKRTCDLQRDPEAGRPGRRKISYMFSKASVGAQSVSAHSQSCELIGVAAGGVVYKPRPEKVSVACR